MSGNIRLRVPAKLASAQPPLGPLLGQHGLNGKEVVGEINKLGEKYESGVLLNIVIKLLGDRKYQIKVKNVLIVELVRQTVGDSGYITLTELYNISEIMRKELSLSSVSCLNSVYSLVVSMGVSLRRE